VLGSNGVRCGVEVDEIARPDIDGARTEPGLARVEAIEIDHALQRVLEIARIVEAGRLDCPGRLEPRHYWARSEEPFCAARQRKAGAHLVENIARDIASCDVEAQIAKERPKSARSHLRPKLTWPVDPGIRQIASNDGPVDRAD
jgi:hypothetical protein